MTRIPILQIRLFSAASATDYVIITKNGKVKHRGPGLSKWVGPRTTIALIPTTMLKKSYEFKLFSSDGQQFTVSGEIVYRINPEAAAKDYDFSVDIDGNEKTDAVAEAGESMVAELRPHFMKFASERKIEELNKTRHVLEAEMQKIVVSLQTGSVSIDKVTVINAAPDAKIGEALMATVREDLLSTTDKAMAARQDSTEETRIRQTLTKTANDRRAAEAAEKVRTETAMQTLENNQSIATQTAANQVALKMKQLENDIAFANAQEADRKTRALAKNQNDTEIELDRAKLVAAQLTNLKSDATAEGEAIQLRLVAYKDMSPAHIFAHAINGKVGDITVTSEFFSLLDRKG